MINGKVEFSLDVPDTATAITLTATYFDTESVINILRLPGETGEYMEIKEKENHRDVSERKEFFY